MAKRHSTRKNLRTRRSIKGRIGGGANYVERLFGGKRRTKMKGGVVLDWPGDKSLTLHTNPSQIQQQQWFTPGTSQQMQLQQMQQMQQMRQNFAW